MNASVATIARTTPPADSHFESVRKYPRQCPEHYSRYEAFADGTAAHEAVLNNLLGIVTPGVRQVHPRPGDSDVSQSFADGSAQRRVALEKAFRV